MTDDQVVREFLRESNAIEGVYDARSLEDATMAWDYLADQAELTPAVVLTTHAILMKHQQLEKIERGHYRKCKVWVGRREGMDWRGIPFEMQTWCTLMNAKYSDKLWKEMHVKYEKIHPFVDGNGRTGRMFMNWHRIRNGERIYVVKASARQAYYSWFK